MAFRPAFLDLELVEDRLRSWFAPLGLPLLAQPGIDLVEAVVGVEHAAHDELWGDRAVPMVLLQAERDVVAPVSPVAVELRSLTERNRATRIAAVAVHPEPKMLPVSDRRELSELAAGRE